MPLREAAALALIFVNRFFHPDRSATGQMLTDLAVDLARSGRKVCVITGRRRYDDPSELLAAREVVDGVMVRRVWTSGFGRGGMIGQGLDYATFFLGACLAVLTMARRGDIVVAMTDPPLLGVPLVWIARLRGARLINWLQDLFPEVGQALATPGLNGMLGRLLGSLRDASLRAAACNVVLGDVMAARVRKAAGSSVAINVIQNWADDAAIRPITPETNSLRQAWCLTDKVVIGYSGNLGRAHDIDTLLDAASRLAHRDDLIFLFVGGGFRHGELQARVAAKGDERFIFKPYQERSQLARSLGVADIHWTSLNPALEGLIVPSKIYGIAAAGRPIIHIGSADGEIARLITDFDCGMVVAEGDGESLAQSIEALCDDPAARRRLGDHARRMVDERYSRAASLALWEELLDELADEGKQA